MTLSLAGLTIFSLGLVALLLAIWCRIRCDLRRLENVRDLVDAAIKAHQAYALTNDPLPDERLRTELAMGRLLMQAGAVQYQLGDGRSS